MSLLIEPKTAEKPGGQKSDLPSYARELRAFHRAFERELRAVIAALPVDRNMRIIDVGCGDGFYMKLFAERLVSPGSVTAFDSNAAYLEMARERLASSSASCDFDFLQGRLEQISTVGGEFDMVWCAQSLFSLPEPVVALKQMASVLRPGGLVVVLENDTLHQLLLPWPSRLELTVRKAELAALTSQTARPDKYYVGRHLPDLFVTAGLEPLGVRSQCIDRQSPFDDDLTEFLSAYLSRLAQRVVPYLDRATSRELMRIVDPRKDRSLLQQPFATITWLNMLAWARKDAPMVDGHGSQSNGRNSLAQVESQPRASATGSFGQGIGTVPVDPPGIPSGNGKAHGGFHLKSKESVTKGMKRLINRQIENLLDLLQQARAGRDRIHDIRKTFKKARALLRLVRRDVGRHVYRRENSRLRDAARTFTAARDAQVLLTSFEDISKAVADKLPGAALDSILSRLRTDAQNAVTRSASQDTWTRIAATLCEFRLQVRGWKLADRDWTDLLKAVRRTYRGARTAWQEAAAMASVENLHEWRKQAKYLWHETEVLDHVGPRAVRQLGKQLHTLMQVLGADHDLAALQHALDEICVAEPSMARLASRIANRRNELQIQAFRLGERLFRDEPDWF